MYNLPKRERKKRIRNQLQAYSVNVIVKFAVPTDYGRPEGEQPSLHSQKFNPNPKFLGVAAAYFVCHIRPIFQISLVYALLGVRSPCFTSLQWCTAGGK